MPPIDRVGQRLKLHDLRVLMMVVQAGSMRKAAALLNTTQPAVSRSIAELERIVGARLLDRTPQGVEPTASGRALLDGSTAVFDELRQAVKTIESLADPAAGEVRIGCNLFLASTFATAVVDRLSRRYPRVVFHLRAAETDMLRRELGERHVDLLIARRFGAVTDDQLDYEFLFDDTFIVAAGARSPWARRRKIELAELVDEAWTLPPLDNLIASVAADAFRANGLGYPRVTVVTGTPQVRVSLLETGRFLTIFPASALRFPTERPEIKVLPVNLSKARIANGIVSLKNRTLSPAARLFIDGARELAKTLAKP
jgi:DNA-binding transcriptional LysR family regulator